jgi:hypothetical protein
MVFAGIAALAMATCVGYYFGRCVGPRPSTPSTWKRRTSRIALGRLTISLLVLLTARQIRQRFRAESILAAAAHLWGLKRIAPVELLRGSVARMRSY